MMNEECRQAGADLTVPGVGRIEERGAMSDATGARGDTALVGQAFQPDARIPNIRLESLTYGKTVRLESLTYGYPCSTIPTMPR
jgi:hypothetical protein